MERRRAGLACAAVAVATRAGNVDVHDHPVKTHQIFFFSLGKGARLKSKTLDHLRISRSPSPSSLLLRILTTVTERLCGPTVGQEDLVTLSAKKKWTAPLATTSAVQRPLLIVFVGGRTKTSLPNTSGPKQPTTACSLAPILFAVTVQHQVAFALFKSVNIRHRLTCADISTPSNTI